MRTACSSGRFSAPQMPIEDMSPIAVEPKFTRQYINDGNNDLLVRRIQHSFDRATWEKDFAIIEGTGHAGVGSVFDLSNARVARLVHSKVILVTPAGIGRPIDEAAVNKALFDRESVEVMGVVMNKVLPEKLESITDTARRGFERLGLELLGVIPRENMLEQSTLEQICADIRGTFLHRGKYGRSRVAHVRIGAMSSTKVFRDAKESTLLVVPGDREDVVLSALERVADQGIPILRDCPLGRYQACRSARCKKLRASPLSGGRFAARQLFDRKPDPFQEREDSPGRHGENCSHPKARQQSCKCFADP